jgi:hypothetical protein
MPLRETAHYEVLVLQLQQLDVLQLQQLDVLVLQLVPRPVVAQQ